MEQKAMFKQMFDFQKNTFENSFKAMSTLREQGEKMVDMFLEKATWLPAEGKKAVEEWIKACNKGSEDFRKFADENLSKVQEYFSAFEKAEIPESMAKYSFYNGGAAVGKVNAPADAIPVPNSAA